MMLSHQPAAVGVAVVAGRVRVPGQGVAHHDRVRALGVEGPVGLVGHLDRRQRRARGEGQRPVRGEEDGAFGLNPSKRWRHGAPQGSEAPAGCQPRLSSRSMEDGIATTRLDDTSAERFVGLRRALGVTSFGMNQILLRPGERGRIHSHAHQEEVYLVLSGRLTVEIEGTPHDLEAGELMRVAPAVRRRVLNLRPRPVQRARPGRDGRARGPRRHRLPRVGRHRGGTPAGDPPPGRPAPLRPARGLRVTSRPRRRPGP